VPVLPPDNHKSSLLPFQDAWSITEQIVHCADVDAAVFQRCRWSIAEPGKQIPSLTQKWAKLMNYQNMDLSEALNMIKSIRKMTASHLKTIVDRDWTKYMYNYGYDPDFNLEETVQPYIDHVIEHRKMIDRNIRMYKEKK